MTDELEPPGMEVTPFAKASNLFAGACKPTPRWREELRVDHHALKEALKQYMAGFWGQARQELAGMQGQVQKLTQAVERQQFLLEAVKTASRGMPKQVQNLCRAVDRQQKTSEEVIKAAMPLQPAHGEGIAKQPDLSGLFPISSFAESVNKMLNESEQRMSERLDEMQGTQGLHLARLNAIRDDERLDVALKQLKKIEESLDCQNRASLHSSFEEQQQQQGQQTQQQQKDPQWRIPLLCKLGLDNNGEPDAEAPLHTSRLRMPTQEQGSAPPTNHETSFRVTAVPVPFCATDRQAGPLQAREEVMHDHRWMSGFSISRRHSRHGPGLQNSMNVFNF